MAGKTKTKPLQALIQSSGMTAAAIVLLFVSVGTVMVPGIFADAASPSISNVSANPGNGPNYGVRVTWDGTTRANWKGQTIRGGKVIDNWNSGSKSYSATGLQCGVTHTFKVAAAGPNGGAQSSWKSASAATRCPGAQVTRIGTVGNRVDVAWRDTAGFSQTYGVQVATNGGSFGYAGTTSATSYSYNGSCGTSYNVRIVANANGQSGPPTAVQSIKTPACPQVPTPGGSTGGGTSGGGSSGGGTSSGGSSGGSSSSSSSGSSGTRRPSGTSAAPSSTPSAAALGNPTNFSADVASHKIVVLTWDAAANAEKYVISRSTDGVAWEEIANTALTSYEDEGADFSTTYYYQLLATGANGQKSELIRTQVTTDAFESSSDTITSQDKLVTAKIPDGAIKGSYSCTITTTEDDESTSDTPEGLSTLLGPYDLLCVTEEGEVVAGFDKAVQFTMRLSSVSNGYQNISVYAVKNGEWQAVKGAYDAEKQQIRFSMTGATSFTAMGEKQSSIWGMVFTIFLVLILIGGAAFGFLWWRRRTPSQAAAVQSEITAEEEFKHALAQPDCSHLSMAQQVIPSSAGCYECEQQGTHWNSLRICLLCGHVGCSDDSPEQHALKHSQATGHPLIYEYGNPEGNTIGWCYIDQTYI